MKIKFSREVQTIAEYAREEAMRTGWYGITPDHLMLAILRHGDNDACRALTALGVNLSSLKAHIDSRIFREEPVPFNDLDKVEMSRAARGVMNMSAFEALRSGLEEVLTAHLLTAISRTGGNATADFFLTSGISPAGLTEYFGVQSRLDEGSALSAPRLEDIAGALGEQLNNLLGAAHNQTNIFS